MFRFLRLLGLASLVLMLASCASHPKITVPPEARFADPGEAVFRSAVTDYLTLRRAPVSSQYEYSRTDLDGDGRREAIVMFTAPYNSWCNKNGCETAIFKAANDHFTLVGKMTPVRGPVLISEAKTHGWRDIVVRVSGRSARPKDVAMKFNGMTYPLQPDWQPALPQQLAMNDLKGLKIFP